MEYNVVRDDDNELAVVATGTIVADPLDESIAKWEFIVAWIKEHKLHVYDGGRDTCALCITHPGCIECPVVPMAADLNCRGTPYRAYCMADDEDSLEAAQAELDFLKSLRLE